MQDGTEITEPVAISNVFNKHFTENGPKLAAQIPTTGGGAVSYNIPQCNGVFELHEVTRPSQICGLIYKLSTSKASGLDNIPVRLLLIFIRAQSLVEFNLKFLNNCRKLVSSHM